MMRRSPLRDRTAERQAVKLNEPGRAEWKRAHWGPCAACGGVGPLVRHHVVYEQHVRAIDPSRAWDLDNALSLGQFCRCHARQHAGSHRLAASILPAAAVEFAVEMLGDGPAALYVARYYADC